MRLGDWLGTAPDQEEECFAAPAADGMSFDEASAFGGRHGCLGGSQDNSIRAAANLGRVTVNRSAGGSQQDRLQLVQLASQLVGRIEEVLAT